MFKRWPIKWLLSGILVIFILSLSSLIFSLSTNNEEELLASPEEKNIEEESIVPETVNNDEEAFVVSKPGENNEEKPVASEPEKNNEEKPVVSEPEKNDEEIAISQITSQEAIEVIRKAYLNSIYIFNRDVDRSQSIEEGMYCRPLDKQLSYNTILDTLNGYYTEGFIERGNISTKALKIHEGNLYVLLLEGNYDYNSNFEAISFSSIEDTIALRVRLITEYDSLESEVILKQEEGKWKVESGIIFPQLP